MAWNPSVADHPRYRPTRPTPAPPAAVGHHQLVVVANRLPVCLDDDGDWQQSPGGLVHALLPVARRHHSAWVGWSGRSDTVGPEFRHDDVTLHQVPLAGREVEQFYAGYANAGLWPLLHDAVRAPRWEPRWWQAYVRVNARFARQTASAAGFGAKVLVQDYHLMLVPAMLRAARPDLQVAFFLHTPFPSPETFLRFPDADVLLGALLDASIVGVQTRRDQEHLEETAIQAAGASRLRDRLLHETGLTGVCAIPISIDVGAWEAAAAEPRAATAAAALRESLGSPARVVLGVDRLDYTKGIESRLLAYQRLLRSGAVDCRDVAFVQVCVPSRESVYEYQQTRRAVEAIVAEINAEFAHEGRPAVTYRFESLDGGELAAHYRAADVMVVTPVRDGMNLVAKEYVASRVDGTGALVLSTGAGSADELRDAHLVAPGDVDGIAHAIRTGLKDDDGNRRRMAALRGAVKANDVEQWANRLLASIG